MSATEEIADLTAETGTTTTPEPAAEIQQAVKKQKLISYIRWFFCCIYAIVFRPSLWTGIISIIAYWDESALRGPFIYDDVASIRNNVVVTGGVPWTEVFTRDFWGTVMAGSDSHKSFRPITTLTLKLNYMLSEESQRATNNHGDTYGFHIVNVILHGFVTFLVTEVAYYVFTLYPSIARSSSYTTYQQQAAHPTSSNQLKQTWRILLPVVITGLVFGLHPVHAEVVSNITSRGELLMSFFTLLGFLSYVRAIPKIRTNPNLPGASFYHRCTTVIGLYITPYLFMILSLFSKEQGATTLLSIVFYDFILHHYSFYEYFKILIRIITKWRQRRSNKPVDENEQQPEDSTSSVDNGGGNQDETAMNKEHQPVNIDDEIIEEQQLVQCTKRAVVLGIETIVAVGYRYYLNGETVPDFVEEQNPAGFAPERLTRILSIPYVYCLYIYDIILPNRLCPDWSGLAIPLIKNFNDPRIIYLFLLWIVSFWLFYSLLFGVRRRQKRIGTDGGILFNDVRPNHHYYYIRQITLISFFAFTFSPFLLSSNLLVVVGLMKADRVIYLPLLGFCFLQGLFYQMLITNNSTVTTITAATTTKKDTETDDVGEKPKDESIDEKNEKATESSDVQKETTEEPDDHTKITKDKKQIWLKRFVTWILYVLFMIQMSYYTRRVHERNIAWSESFRLWMLAFEVNPRGHHTRYNAGFELSLKQRYPESEYVLRSIGDASVAGPINTFVYAMALSNLNRCHEAMPYLDRAFEWIRDKEEKLGDTPRNTETYNQRVKSDLTVAKAYCTAKTGNIQQAVKLMVEAVNIDPTNQYAMTQANDMFEKVQAMFNQFNQQ